MEDFAASFCARFRREPAFLVTHFKWEEKFHELMDYLRTRWPRARIGLIALERLADGLSSELGLHWCKLLRDDFPFLTLPFSSPLISEIRAADYDALCIPVKRRAANPRASVDMSGYPWVHLFAWRTGIERVYLYDADQRFRRIPRRRLFSAELTNQARVCSSTVRRITTNMAMKDRFGVSLKAVWQASAHLRDPEVRTPPRHLSIEPTNICNLRCAFCECGQGALHRPKGSMSFDTFKDLLRRFPKTLEFIYLNSWGESFLHPRIYEMIDYAREWAPQVSIDTNGNHLDPEAVVRSRLSTIVFSVDGLTQETYERLRKNGNLQKLLQNLEGVIEWKRKLNSRNPQVVFKFIVMKQNEQQIEEARSLAGHMGADVFKLDMFTARRNPHQMLEFIPRTERYSRYVRTQLRKGIIQVKYRTIFNQCSWQWTGMTVYWDGSVYPCGKYPYNFEMGEVSEHSDRFRLGNILEVQDCMEIWNGPHMQRFRRNLQRGEISTCHNCISESYHD